MSQEEKKQLHKGSSTDLGTHGWSLGCFLMFPESPKKEKGRMNSRINQKKATEGTIRRRNSNRTLEGGGKMELKLAEEEGSLGPKS